MISLLVFMWKRLSRLGLFHHSIFFVSLGLIFFLTAQNVSAAVPGGFSTTTIVPTLSTPTGFAFAPDGRIFIIEKGGAVKIYKNGELLSQPFVQLPVNQDGERGLLGIAIDPDFSTNKFIYFNYTSTDLKNTIVRYTATTDVSQNGQIVKEIQMSTSLIHVGGTIGFGNDGKLYISVGDSGTRENAQKLSSLHGKILRINKDGTTPEDNPFVSDENAAKEIWAYGLRNPFRFQFDSVSGKLYVGDVGENTWEEINIINKGGNYGWPEAEGKCDNCPYVNPFYVYQRQVGGGSSVTGGPIYRGTMFPNDYVGDLFFADYVMLDIKRLDLSGDGSINSASDFDPEAGTVVDLKVAPDGSLYYLTIFPGKLFRVSYNTANQPPIAKATADKKSGEAPLTVKFSSEGSQDPEGEELLYTWDFGDGTTSSDPSPTKIYNKTGIYSVTLQVSDGTQTDESEQIQIKVGGAPNITITAPTNNSKYNAGDVIQFSATAVDSAGENIPQEGIKTEVIFHHNDHIHPFLLREGSSIGTFTIPTDGHTAVDTWYEVKFTAKDSSGIDAEGSAFIYPNTTSITVNSEPSGLQVYVDGIPTKTPVKIEGVVGFHHELNVAATQKVDGKTYNFDKWSNTGVAQQSFTATAEPKLFTAYFSESQPYYAQYYSNKNLSGNSVLTRWEDSINFDWGDNGSPGEEVTSDNFSARFSGKQDFPAGNYKFTLSGDDGIRLYVDGVLVIDEWKDQGKTAYSSNLLLSAGVHDIRVEYYENGGGANVKLDWEYLNSNDESITYDAKYFDNMTLSGSPVLERKEFGINNNWGHGSPDALVPVDQFSTIWEGKKIFTEGFYKFNFNTDDGFRFYIDGKKVLDRWFPQSSEQHSIEEFISGGEHTIRLEFYENTGSAIIKMSYLKIPSLAKTFKVEYFDNMTLSGTPKVTNETTNSMYNWWLFSPIEGVDADKFSVRMTKQQVFAGGEYTFRLVADDGVRFWIDNTLIVDDWTDHARREYNPSVAIPEGLHNLKIEYYEHTGLATLSFEQL